MDARRDRAVPPERLRGQIDPETLGRFESTDDLLDGLDPMTAGLAFQPRVREALALALAVRDPYFNVYAAGETGLRKRAAILAVLEDEARRRETPPDWCYVFDFRDPARPRALPLPPGEGRAFARQMAHTVETLRRDIPRALDTEAYRNARQALSDEVMHRRQEIFEGLEAEAHRRGLSVEMTPGGIVMAPLDSAGEPLSAKAFEKLPDDAKQRFEAEGRGLRSHIEKQMRAIRAIEREGKARREALDRETAFLAAGEILEGLRERYPDQPRILRYVDQVQDDVAEHLDDIRAEERGGETSPMLAALEGRSTPFDRYRVNVLVDRSEEEGAPVVYEAFPTYVNLTGRIERRVAFGNLVADFTLLRAGALHRANGGFLVLFVDDLLRQPGAWDAVKRSLKAREIIMEDLPAMFGFSVAQALGPEPIPMNARVVLVGSPILHQILYALDPDFRKLFQIRADFDDRIEVEGNTEAFAAALARLCRDEETAPLDRGGVARMAEHAMRVAEDQRKLTTRLSLLAQLLHEADRIRREAGADHIGSAHVRAAETARRYRNGLPAERLQDLVRRGVLLVRTEGRVAGQINGLALSFIGEATLGRPVRISAAVSPGQGDVADLERRSELGGRIHTKAVMILSGYLASRYAADIPLAIAAQLTFEQSYAEIEGDSASLAETLALLSAIGRFPLEQGIAVTGSVSHAGDVQPVGGVSDKIEGYYDVCAALGLTGAQGVIVPTSNLDHLHLRDDVVDAVREGRFHVWSVSRVDEALEILSGLPAGVADAEGRFAAETANGRVQARLVRFARLAPHALPRADGARGNGHPARPGPETPHEPPPEPDVPPGGPPPPPRGGVTR
jgi:predicted ATP-dependent protease